MGTSAFPSAAPSVDPTTGALAGATAHYRKALRDLEGVFIDQGAFAETLAATPDAIVYEVYEVERSEDAGDLIFGTSILEPGAVGSEYHMTRGHIHTVVDRVETYYCLRGKGVLLLESIEGEVETIELAPGVVAYVPPARIHRSVNTGDEPLVTLFCYPADAGHGYGIVEAAGGMRSLVVRTDDGGWTLEDNPRYRPRRA
ncbi:MAG: glucose-6-phosphate isomerase [Gaiellaceae bacterium]